MSWSFELPRREPPLSVNAARRVHWARVHREHRLWSDTAAAACLAAIPAAARKRLGAVHIVLRVRPPDRRKRDSDNLVAHLLKPVKDGIAWALDLPDDTDRYCSWQVVLEPPDGERRWRYVVEVSQREEGREPTRVPSDPTPVFESGPAREVIAST